MAEGIGAAGLAAARMAERKSRSLLAMLERTGSADWNRLAEALSGPGEQLEETPRGRMERLVGRDLSEVRLHGGPWVEQVAAYLGAEAFTIGSHVFASAGSVSPMSPRGSGLLAHELTHVVQQTQPRQLAGVPGAPIGRQGPSTGPVAQLAADDEERRVAPGQSEAEARAVERSARQAAEGPEPAGLRIDLEALAERVYRLMREEIIQERERGLRVGE